MLATAIALTASCAGVLGLEDEIPYGTDATFTFPSCSGATGSFLCDEQPSPSAWPPFFDEDFPDAGGSCRREPVGADGALKVSCVPSTGATRENEPWCATRAFSHKGAGFRLQASFRVDAAKAAQGLGLLGVFMSEHALVIELVNGTLVARPFRDDLPVPFDPPSKSEIAPLDAEWHRLSMHVTAAGQANIILDGTPRASPIDFGPLGAEPIEVSVLDSATADIAASVTIDNVVAIPY